MGLSIAFVEKFYERMSTKGSFHLEKKHTNHSNFLYSVLVDFLRILKRKIHFFSFLENYSCLTCKLMIKFT